jgi:acyl-CoA synthetase (AMP-forming)/AMP-acid ligase II
LYRTGDLLGWLPGGQLECFGRKDQQKKLHDHLIELGKIEHALLQTKQGSDCIIALIGAQGKEQLVAFCIFPNSKSDVFQILPPQSHIDDAESLSSKLSTLPLYMIPKVWIPVSSFPLMPSGKPDRWTISPLVQDMDAIQLSKYSVGVVQMIPPQTMLRTTSTASERDWARSEG